MPTPVLPDPVELGIQAITARPQVAPLVATRIYGAVPGSPTWPLWVLTEIDSGENSDGGGIARLQLDAWGLGNQPAHKHQTRQHAAVFTSLIRDLRGAYAAGRISSSAHLITGWLPDPGTGRARHTVDFEIEYYPL